MLQWPFLVQGPSKRNNRSEKCLSPYFIWHENEVRVMINEGCGDAEEERSRAVGDR